MDLEARRRTRGLAALEAVLLGVLVLAGLRQHATLGLESGYLAVAFLLAPGHARRLLALLGIGEPPSDALLWGEIVVLSSLASYHVASFGPGIALALVPAHAHEADASSVAVAPRWLGRACALAALGAVGVTFALGRGPLDRVPLVLGAALAGELLVGGREGALGPTLRRLALFAALPGLPWLPPLLVVFGAAVFLVTTLLLGRPGAPATTEVGPAIRRLVVLALVAAALAASLSLDTPAAVLASIVLAAAATPVAWGNDARRPGAALVGRSGSALLVLALGGACLVVLLFTIHARPRIGGIDFLYYVVNARDLHETGHAAPEHDKYFPGVFVLWRSVLALAQALGWDELPALQWSYVALLGVNVGLVTALVGRVSRSAALAVLAGLWTAVVAADAEGVEAGTEPLATAPVLFALLAWSGEPLRGVSGLVRAALLGIGLGLALHAKQQGGLLALGALSFLPGLATGPREARHDLRVLAGIPLVAGLVFVACVAGEGRGLEPIRAGLGYVSRYDARSAFVENVREAVGSHPFAALTAALGALSGLGAALAPRSGATAEQERSARLACFAAVAGLASLYQFSRRSYAHYLLLGTPFLVLATVLFVVSRGLPSRATGARRALAAAVFATLFLASPARPWLAFVSPALAPENPEPFFPTRWFNRPGFEPDLERARAVVARGSRVVVVPAVELDVQLFLGTRSARDDGYPWLRLDRLLPDCDAKTTDAVVFVPPDENASLGDWAHDAFEELPAALEARGYRLALERPTIRVWKRP